MSRKKKNFLSILLNLVIVIFTVISVVHMSVNGLDGNMAIEGLYAACYFTVDSNILCGIASLMVILSFMFSNTPKWVVCLKLMATTAVTITFLVVMFMLGPAMGYKLMFMGANIYMHLLTPILAIISFIFFDPIKSIKGKDNFYSVIPVFIYGSFYLYNVVIKKSWFDFYGFNSGTLSGLWYISYPAILLVAFLLSVVLYKLHKVCG